MRPTTRPAGERQVLFFLWCRRTISVSGATRICIKGPSTRERGVFQEGLATQGAQQGLGWLRALMSSCGFVSHLLPPRASSK
jgi:hypothetical protein